MILRARRNDASFDHHGLSLSDATCLGCGYDIRGLGSEALCPECAVPIARSRAGDLLAVAGRGWISRVRRGARLIDGACVLFAVTALLAFVFVVLSVVLASLGSPAPGILERVILWLALPALLGVAVSGSLGVLWTTSRRAGEPDRGWQHPARRARVLLAAVLITLGCVPFSGRYFPLGGSAPTFLVYAGVLFWAALAMELERWRAVLTSRVPAAPSGSARGTAGASVARARGRLVLIAVVVGLCVSLEVAGFYTVGLAFAVLVPIVGYAALELARGQSACADALAPSASS